MTREEQVKFCKSCVNRSFASSQGLICKLTNQKADFQFECVNYQLDEVLIKKEEQRADSDYFTTNKVSSGKRLANYIIDRICIFIFKIILALTTGLILGIILPSFIDTIEENSLLFEYLFTFVSTIIYYTLFEALSGRTIGKLITKTKVVDENKNSIGFSTAFIRSLTRFIPFEAFSFLGSEVRGWHDTISKTYVVNAVDKQEENRLPGFD